MQEYKNIKILLQKVPFQIDLEKCLSLKKLKVLFRGHISWKILKVKKLLERFMKKKYAKNKSKRAQS